MTVSQHIVQTESSLAAEESELLQASLQQRVPFSFQIKTTKIKSTLYRLVS